jgi:hypothetical protein
VRIALVVLALVVLALFTWRLAVVAREVVAGVLRLLSPM